MRAHDNFDIVIELDEEAEQPFNRKLAKFAAQHLGDVRLAHAKQVGRLLLGQAASLSLVNGGVRAG